MDYTDIRKLAIEFSGLSGMDDTYTFYYDETNNSRKFRITEKDFNSSKDEDFVTMVRFVPIFFVIYGRWRLLVRSSTSRKNI